MNLPLIFSSFLIFCFEITSYDKKGGWVSIGNTRFAKLTEVPAVQKFTVKIANVAKKAPVGQLRAVVAVRPGSQLALSDLTVSID